MSRKRPALGVGRTLGAVAIVALVVGAFLFGPDLWRAWRFQRAMDADARIAQAKGPAPRALAQTCGLCHGVDGSGRNQNYPHLAGQPAAYLEAQLAAFASGARKAPQMQPIAMELLPAERGAISRYYASFAPRPNDGFVLRRPLGPEAAALTRSCTACHGADLQGAQGPVPAPRLAGQARTYLARQLRAYRDGARLDPTGAMPAVAKAMSDPQIELVSDALAGR